jgi:hypothetical protein
MSALRIRAAEDALHRVRVDLLAVGLHEDERPLRGAAGRVDWRLCGAFSRLIRADRVRGARGEAVLMPAGRGLAAARVLGLGLGPVGRCDETVRRAAVVDVLARTAALRLRSLALPLPFAGGAEDDERELDALLEAAATHREGGVGGDALLVLVGRPGLLAALRARARSAPPGLRIQLPEEPRSASPAGVRGLSAGA